MASADQAAKQLLRARVLAARDRRTRTGTDLDDTGPAIARHVTTRWPSLKTVAVYLSVGTEPSTGPLIDSLRTDGTRVLLPVITGDHLDWAAYTAPADLTPGPLGIRQPTGPRLGAAAIESADLVVVPALAVDRHGHRLGRGRGFYDRALESVRAPIAAVVFDAEVLGHVPSEPHDRGVDVAVTPSGVVDLSRSGAG